MINNSKQNMVTLAAHTKGYRVRKSGKVVGVKGSVLSLAKNKKGYYRFSMRHDGKIVSVMVHKLQAFQKFGEEAFYEGMVIRHQNDKEFDNSHKNLILGTQAENMADKKGKKYRKKN